MTEISFANRIALFFPALKRDLRIAHLPYTPVEYVSKNIKTTLVFASFFTFLFFFVLQKAQKPVLLLMPIFLVSCILIFEFSIISIRSKIKKREHEIDKEVLFVGRYLLVKLYSGRPLLNAIIETANSRGLAAKYMKEVVEDINTGSTIENALNSAMIYSPSEKLRKVLFHVNNALQLGIDVTKPLESVLEEITKEEEIEIKKYGKTLNTLVIFYMLGAVILPSLGAAIFIVISSFVSLPIKFEGLLVFVFFLVVLEIIFLTLFKSSRPMVNL